MIADHAQAIPMLVSVLVSGQQARTGNPGPVLLEQQHTTEMHFPFFGAQPPPEGHPQVGSSVPTSGLSGCPLNIAPFTTCSLR